MDNILADFSKLLVALFTLAIIAVLAANKQTATFVGDLGKFLVAMVQKVQGTAAPASASSSAQPGGTATMGSLTATFPDGTTQTGN